MSFSVVIDSFDNLNSTSIYEQEYAIDWSFLEEGEYDLTFSFTSSAVGATATNVKGISLLGLGTQMKTYNAGSSTDTKSSPIIGLLNRTIFNDGANKQIFTQSDYNPIVVLNSRPSNNIFKVKIIASSTQVATTGMGASYILMLGFTRRK